ncbi:ParB/RepB/Spo0J family partition protein [Clostridium butyricum]|uniref:ParB/RepB/Spo0J family partition protein n=1 Tax=Clostridium butyricum TaxID=1492 RepID=UPI00071B14AA|nr:ParB N-terminal domain-containing protein [Clostridium butyricum]ALP91206.1 chromosome partitioning protein ParB [Clostridium butyricum]ANF14829.1 chromosome partitioning protein ParB [Clostridium butyricum]MCI3009060.1 ParB N-terminal domain-containing protein [Clostridium butyricum]MDP0841124.1 ParB N-terminal domain-containing protein [Clostridium butyricum]NVO92965.1 ParB N-terminal domain-containing protein [Clostridium butyricum]
MSSYLKGIASRVNNINNTDDGFVQELDIDLLVPSENNFYGIREIEELAESIKEYGLMHNVVVRKRNDGKYEILSGERRFRALREIDYKKVPCRIVKDDVTELDAEVMLIQANMQQRELNLQEKMQGIKRLQEIYTEKRKSGEKLQGKTRDLIGKHLGISGVQVGRYQKIDKDLIEPLKEKLNSEDITVTQAHTLSSLTEEEQEIINDEIKDLNCKEHKEEVETLINGIKQPVENKHDKELIDEMYSESHSESCIVVSDCAKNADETEQKKEIKTEDNEIQDKFDELKEMIKQSEKIDLVINMSYIKGCFRVSEIELKHRTLEIYLKGQKNILKIEINTNDYSNQLKKVHEICYGESTLKPKKAYKINLNTYLWFH